MPAKSAAQQKAAGAALSAKRGKTSPSKLKGPSKSMYQSMSERQLDEFASTKRKGKPEHVSEGRAKPASSRAKAKTSSAKSKTSSARSKSSSARSKSSARKAPARARKSPARKSTASKSSARKRSR
jgi:hypothetical protein